MDTSDGARHNKVQFEEESDEFSHESLIKVVRTERNKFDVHLGFLQLNHYYEICTSFDIDSSRLPLMSHEHETPSLHARIKSLDFESDMETDTKEAEGASSKCHLILTLFAHKERLLKERIYLKSDGEAGEIIVITLIARVLGKGKGTPSLRQGIKCTGHNEEDDSEQSDWQGFNWAIRREII